jgi:type VI secretion system FHA domain protein
MALKLRVISDHYKQLGKQSSRLFGVHGGRIGRSSDNDLILPDNDRYVSSHHAKVTFRGGQWILEDTSTNGVFVNGSDTPIAVEGPHVMQDGDRLRLGDYEILVSIDERSDFPTDASGQMPAPSIAKGKRKPVAPTVQFEDLGEELDITDLLTDGYDDLRAPASAPDQPIAPGRPIPASDAISLLPDTGDSGEQRTVVHSKKPPEWEVAARPSRDRIPSAGPLGRLADPERLRKMGDGASELHAGVEAFCRGAGIDPTSLGTDAQATLLSITGQMFREVVLGMMEVLKERSNVKQRFKISQTTIQPSNNNPLKFSAGVDEAIHKLLDGHNSRDLGPIDALREAFADIKTHQTSLANSMQHALGELMQRIEPKELQERFDRGLKRGSILSGSNKGKYWDLYAEFYTVLNQRDEMGLPAAFAEDFARAYDDKNGDGKVAKRK